MRNFAQNSIDYMVYHRPDAAQQILRDFGRTPPNDIHELVHATKALITKEGKVVIQNLLSNHPDRSAILNEFKSTTNCSSCGTTLLTDKECSGCKMADQEPYDNYTNQSNDLPIVQNTLFNKQELVLLSVVFMAGFLMGSHLKKA